MKRTIPLLAVALHGHVFAQAALPASLPPFLPPPDAGAFETQRERTERANRENLRPEAAPGPVIETTPQAPAPKLPSAGPRFVLKKVEFTPSAFLTPAELAAIAERHVGQETGMAELAALLDDVNALYAQRGIATALAVLAPQRIVGGEVKVELIEGKLARVQVDGRYTRDDFVRAHISTQAGDVVDVRRLERDLIWFNRTHDVQAKVTIKPGDERGATDVLLALSEPARVSGKLFMDNQESESLGRYQAGFDVRVSGLLGRADALTALVSKSKGGVNGLVGYAVPVNTLGGLVSLTASRNTIAIVDGPYAALDITGISKRLALSATQPVYVDRNWLFSVGLSHAKSNSSNEIAGVPLSQFDTDANLLSLQLERQGEGNQWQVQASAERGKSVDQFQDRQSFTLLSLNASGALAFGKAWYGLARLGFRQTSAATLPPSSRFPLGGPGTVRGYAPGVASGLEGRNLSVELHRAFDPGIDVFTFYDQGQVASPAVPVTQLAAVGVGANWTIGPFTTRLVLGSPLKKIRPDQGNLRLDARLEYAF